MCPFQKQIHKLDRFKVCAVVRKFIAKKRPKNLFDYTINNHHNIHKGGMQKKYPEKKVCEIGCTASNCQDQRTRRNQANKRCIKFQFLMLMLVDLSFESESGLTPN